MNLLYTCLESLTQIDGGLICPKRQCVFTHNPIQQISYNDGQKKNFNEIGASIMALDANCTEQLVVFSSTWHKIVDIETGRKIREIYDQDGFVSAVCWSPNNPNIFASTGTDSSVRTWDIRGHPAQTLQLRRQRRYRSIAYSPDSNFLAFAGEFINLVDLSNPRNIPQINSPSPILTVRFNPVEYLLATSSDDRVIRFWDIDTTECVSQSLPFDSAVKNIEFDSQGKYLVASCGSVVRAFHWEPFECVGQIDLLLNTQNLSGTNSVPSSDGLVSNRPNSAFKSLDLQTLDDTFIQFSFDDSAQKRLLLHSIALSDLCSSSPHLPIQYPDFIQNVGGTFTIESPTNQQWESGSNRSASLSSTFNESPDSTIGIIQSFPVTRDRHQSNSDSADLIKKTMTGSCISSGSIPITNKLPSVLATNQHLARPHSLTASHSESRIQKPTRARSNVRLNTSKETRGSQSTLNQRAPSVESSRTASKQNKQPVTPVEERTFVVKRNGSLPTDNGQAVAEKHTAVMEMLNSRIRDCRRINSLLKLKNGEDEALEEAARLNDGLHMFAQLLHAYKQNPTTTAYNLKFCARAIPTLRTMLSHKNATYVDLALDTLANILNEFTEPIKHALAPNAVSIGVDLAAEQRHLHCTSCKQSLTEIYINSSFILEKLSPPQRDYFQMLLPMIMTLIDD